MSLLLLNQLLLTPFRFGVMVAFLCVCVSCLRARACVCVCVCASGKFSFPIIHSIRATPDNRQLMSILRQRTEDVSLKRFAIELVEKSGSFAYTRQVLIKVCCSNMR